MLEYLSNYISQLDDNSIFMFCALAGSGLLLIQFILKLFGITDDIEGDGDGNQSFKYLSIQTIGGFFMMFGWTALAFKMEFNFQTTTSILVSLMAGLCGVFLLNLIYKTAKKLHSPGNICNLDEVIGKEALVYQQIVKDGVGKVSITFQHITCEVNAISGSEEDLPSFTRVQIIKKQNDNTVVVIPIK